jgi:hypothetical protein
MLVDRLRHVDRHRRHEGAVNTVTVAIDGIGELTDELR